MSPEEEFYNKLFIQFGQVTVAVMFLPVIVALVHYRQLNRPARLFFYYLVVAILANLVEQAFIWSVNHQTDFWMPYLTKWGIGDTNFLGILSYLNDFILLGMFFSQAVAAPTFNAWVKRAAALFAIFALIDYIWITGYNATGVLTPTLDGFFASVLPLILLGYLVRRDYPVSIYKIPYFWFCCGLMVAHLLALLFFMAGEKIYDTDFKLYVQLYLTGNALNIIAQLLYAVGFRHARMLRYL